MISLEQARVDVSGWLDEARLTTGKCSQLLRNQLAEHIRQRTQNVFWIYDEIGHMEQSDFFRCPSTKAAEPYRRELQGLWKKHYKVSSLASFALNLGNHWKRKENWLKLKEIIDNFNQDRQVGKLAHELTINGYQDRHEANQVTGEWIVFTPIGGVNYYLTLATHQEPDSVIKERVRSCFSEFPELAGQLGW